MAAIRSRRAEPVRVAGFVLCGALLLAMSADAQRPLRDAPVEWYEDDQRPLETDPEERDPNLNWDYFNEAIVRPVGYYTDPGRFVRRLTVVFGGERDKESPNINSLGEVPNSSWFTNRIGLFPMSATEVARGPGRGEGPSREGPWTIVAAKTQGVTPGFTIRDARGDHYLIKFDSKKYPGISTAAGAISARLLHAAGYNVPEDEVVFFRAEDLTLADDVELTLPDGSERSMVPSDVDAILDRVHQDPDGRIRAISSRFVSGKPLGPFDYMGRRDDDPNDTVKHHHRRELRGLEVFAAWIDHFDTKQHNSLDVLVEEDGRRFVKHYLIDFASTLGTGAHGPAHRFGWESTLDPKAFLRRTLNLGLWEDDWRKVRRPEGLDEVAFFEAVHFDPLGFEPIQPNPAFQRINTRDGYWAAKIVSAFTDEHLRAVVEEARYRNPDAARYVATTLAARRDKIARAWFDRIAPLDFFRHENGVIVYRDLGAERGIYPGTTPRYRARAAAVSAAREVASWSDWRQSERTEVRPDGAVLRQVRGTDGLFLAVQCSVDRGEGWSAPVTVYVAPRSGRVIAVDRAKE